MREIRTSGSEGGVGPIPHPYLYMEAPGRRLRFASTFSNASGSVESVEDDPIPFDAKDPEFTETGSTCPAPGKLGPKRNVLFVCSRNQWRSPTAERVWQSHPLLSVRSAGTSPSARRRVSAADIAWAEVILVMEEKHRARLLTDYADLLGGKTVHVLGIPDEYRYMDPELVDELTGAVAAILGFE